MAGFNAAEAVVKLDWTFAPYLDASGVVPEPSTEQVGDFFDALRDALDRPKDESDTKVVEFMEQTARDQRLFSDPKVLAAYAGLCSGQPTVEQLAALPHRQRQAFFGWITGQVLDPT